MVTNTSEMNGATIGFGRARARHNSFTYYPHELNVWLKRQIFPRAFQ
jgi:hypothetical protein